MTTQEAMDSAENATILAIRATLSNQIDSARIVTEDTELTAAAAI